jgi:DNA-binding transcriptional ArsR family regulator
MKNGPDIALVASLLGDPARANMLTALMTGRALTASELAREGGVTPQTASSHLAKLEAGGLLALDKQGRHRYYKLTGPDVASVIEGLMGLAARVGHTRVRTGPKDPALRHARACYDHLAGDLGVALFDGLISRKLLRQEQDAVILTPSGAAAFKTFGIDVATLPHGRRPLCKACLDWSSRRSHLGGALGVAILARLYDLKWASREPESRIVAFTRRGEDKFRAEFGLAQAKPG